jgi:hypothetical protein
MNSPSLTPGPAFATRFFASTSTPFMSERSIINPPSQTPWPATEWPPPRTETSMSWSRAKRTDRTTSCVFTHRAMSAGRRSIMPLKTLRTSS